MAYFEINSLLVKHKSYEGIKTVLDIDHLEIQKGETYGIVGESGQGKTVLALTILQLLQTPPGFIEKGEIMRPAARQRPHPVGRRGPAEKIHQADAASRPRQQGGHDLPGSHELHEPRLYGRKHHD